MAKIIEAKAVIRGEDQLGPLVDKLGKKFDHLAKGMKSAEGVDKMAAALGKVKTQIAAIEKFNAARLGFAGARDRFRQTQVAVENAARAIKNAEAPTRQLQTAYERAQRAVQAAARAFDTQKAAVIGAKRALEQTGIPINGIVAQQARLAAAVDRTNAALDRQHAKGNRLRTGIGNVASNVGFFTGPAILRGTKEAVEGGAEIQSQIVKMRAAGVPEEDIQRETDRSAQLAAKYTNVKRSDIMERYSELRTSVNDPNDAAGMLETVIKANSAINAIDRSGKMAEGLQFALKGADILGLNQDLKRYEAYLDSYIRAQQVMGKSITPEQMYEFAKYTKASGATLSDRFKFTTGVSMAQEMGGSTVGVSIDQFVKQVVGGFQGSQHAAAKEFVKLGLANADDFEKTKTGDIKGLKPGRHVAGHRLAMTDPDLWVNQFLVPALEKAGHKSEEDQVAMVRRLFPSGRAADIVAKLITQRPSIEAQSKLYEKAQGINAYKTNQQDPFVALNSLSTSLKNFAATVTSPMMENAAKAMSGMASWMGGLGEAVARWQKENPDAAKVVSGGAVAAGAVGGGVLTYNLVSGLMTGFGLKGSALALDGSAAALTRAAILLGGSKAPDLPVPGAKDGGKSWAGAVWNTVKSGAGVVGGAVATYAPGVIPPAAVIGGFVLGGYALHEQSKPYSGMTGAERARARRGGKTLDDVFRDHFNEDRDRLNLPRLGNDRPTEVNGKVTGEARVTIEIPGLAARTIGVPLQGRLDNGPGSVGVSSPDAQPWRGGIGRR